MSYLDGIDFSTGVSAARAVRAIRATRPMSTAQARRLIDVSVGALERANAEDDSFVDISVKRLDLIRVLSDMDKKLAGQRADEVLPERAAGILRDVAIDAIDEFDAAADDVESLAAEREGVYDDIIGNAELLSQPSRALTWVRENPWRAATGAATAIAALAVLGLIFGGRRRR